MELDLRNGRLSLDVPALMGVVNVTPDSFSDGGEHFGTDRAVARGIEMVGLGARIVDVGGESTRPGAPPITVDEELRRVIPVIEQLAAQQVIVSIDTRRADVADRAVQSGASIINDVSGLRDPAMRSVAARHGVAVVIMHMPIDDPATMQQHAVYDDVVASVSGFLAEQMALAREDGVAQVIIDPGIGFGKTTSHNLEILRRLDEIVDLGAPVMVGASRKRFIGERTGSPATSARMPGTLAAHLWAISRGARIIRAHDVAAHTQALGIWQDIAAFDAHTTIPSGTSASHEAVVALGTNLGDRLGYLRFALDELAPVRLVSDVYETGAVGGPDGQAPFLNMVAVVDTDLSPETFLRRLHDIEHRAGRQRTIHWGPRTLDLDLLFHDDVRIDTDELTVPHPRIAERPFVTAPLADVAPRRVPHDSARPGPDIVRLGPIDTL